MKLERRIPSGRERDGAAVKLLAKLREQLYSSHAFTRRRAASRLSWMQEDGLDILKEALFGETPRGTKSAATYGLRKMQGRMKEMAFGVLQEGLKDKDSETREVCENALLVLSQQVPGKFPVAEKVRERRAEIKEIPARSPRDRRVPHNGKRIK
jgi:hypothetical protein